MGCWHGVALPVGQREDEAAAVSGLALDPDAAAVQLDEPLREREAEAGAFSLLLSDVGLLELLEDAFLVFGGDARAGIRDRDAHLAVVSRGRDDDASAAGREFDR